MFNDVTLPNGQQMLTGETVKLPINYFCTYTPEEMLLAAGYYPRRIIPNRVDPSLANTFLDSNFCPYVRSILAWGMESKKMRENYPTVIVNSCDGMRRLYDVWRYYVKSPLTVFLDLPRKRGLIYEEQYKLQLEHAREQLEKYSKQKITDKKLNLAIRQGNEFRKIIRQLDEMRKQKIFDFSGYDFFRLIQDGSRYTKPVYIEYLKNFLHKNLQNCSEKQASSNKSKKPFNILLTGTVLDHLDIIKTIEQYGGFIKVSDTCNGWRYYLNAIDENEEDHMKAIAHFYLNKIACPRMLESREKEDALTEMINKERIEGVIFYTLKFCDTALFQLPVLREKLKLLGIPSLYLEGDFGAQVSGQLKTRIQAFLEALEFA